MTRDDAYAWVSQNQAVVSTGIGPKDGSGNFRVVVGAFSGTGPQLEDAVAALIANASSQLAGQLSAFVPPTTPLGQALAALDPPVGS